MTIDERFERLELFMAGLGEQFRKEREESRQLWRETQNEIISISRKLNDLTELFLRSKEEAEQRRQELDERFRETDEKFRQTDARIQALVSAMGEWMRKDTRPGISS
jgi:predicted  nucleic acid-binding Zn-ribbon protein